MIRSKWLVLFCLVALVGLVGCPGGDSGTAPVSGTVTLDGQPVDGASVAFSPKSGDGQAAAAMTNSEGRFEMANGAAPGSYGVTVTKTAAAAPTVEDPRSRGGDLSAADAEAISKMAEGGEDASTPTDMLPAKYKSTDTSGLTAEVPAGGTDSIKLELITK